MLRLMSSYHGLRDLLCQHLRAASSAQILACSFLYSSLYKHFYFELVRKPTLSFYQQFAQLYWLVIRYTLQTPWSRLRVPVT